ncbi:MAG TPA: MarR family transcriptional regulator [Terriglobia bacterium]|nr:MarR family transcriptional regulator [Terriglobia bacterium]
MDKLEYVLLASFRYALRQFLRFSEEGARAVGLEPQQHQALLAVKGFPDRDHVTIGELAERLQIRHHSAIGLIDRLVTKKLLSRHTGREDRREVCVTLTSRGELLLERLSATHQEELRRMGPQLISLLTLIEGGSKRLRRKMAGST